jgi:hypothetical protein
MARIFISYRREDSRGFAHRLADKLHGFGDVFIDVDTIPLGVDFREHIAAAVARCDILLAVIGPRWSGTTESGRRIDEDLDYVRIEIESALSRNIPVVPVLIDDCKPPNEVDLPVSVARLAYRNGMSIDQGQDFHVHVDRLIRGIEFHVQKSSVAQAKPPHENTSPETSGIYYLSTENFEKGLEKPR